MHRKAHVHHYDQPAGEPMTCEFWDTPTAALCGAAEEACEQAKLWGVPDERALFERDDDAGEYWIVGHNLTLLPDE